MNQPLDPLDSLASRIIYPSCRAQSKHFRKLNVSSTADGTFHGFLERSCLAFIRSCTRLARSNSQVRTRTEKYSFFPIPLTASRIGNLTRVDPYSCYMCDYTYLNLSSTGPRGYSTRAVLENPTVNGPVSGREGRCFVGTIQQSVGACLTFPGHRLIKGRDVRVYRFQGGWNRNSP